MSSADDWRGVAVLYLTKAKDAEKNYREQKAEFDRIKASYMEQFAAAGDAFALANAAHKAGSDPRRQDAAKNAAWFRDEANMYANLANAAFVAAASADTQRQKLGDYMRRPKAAFEAPDE